MIFPRNISAQLSCLLFIAGVSQAAPGDELFTNYNFNGTTYPSLHAAENALWSSPTLGYAHYGFLDTSANGFTRTYWRDPAPVQVIDPKLVFTSVPGIPCDDSPLLDQWGHDWCIGAFPGTCCASQENWWVGVDSNIGAPECPIMLTAQSPWYESSIAKTSYPLVQPEEILILGANYFSYIETDTGPGGSSQCNKHYDFTLNAVSPGYCPSGWGDFQWWADVDGGIYQCQQYFGPAFINRTGAITPEPNSTSCSAGNPCHPTTGDKTLAENDFSSASFQLTRHYHSLQNYPDYAAMGKGWSHSYSGRIIVDGNITRMIDGKGDAERFACVDLPTCTTYRSEGESGHILRPVAGGWDVYLNSGVIHQYDSSGKLILITDQSSNFRQIAITYTADNHVLEVIDQKGRALQFSYNSNGLVDAITLPDGQQILYDYGIPAGDTTNNPKYNLVKVIRQDLTERVYLYEDIQASLLTGITDENGNRFATYAYDDAARVISSEHANGAGRVTLNYTNRPGDNFTWSITEVTMPLGEVVTYDMESGAFRKPIELTDSRGSLIMTYDTTTGWRNSRIDREGNPTSYEYDGLHQRKRIEAMGTPDERRIETDWNDTVNRISELREPGKTTTFTLNSRGQILTRTLIDTATLATRTWTNTYFETPSLGPLIGQIQTVDGPRTDVADVTIYEYFTTDHPSGEYLTGDLKAVINALGHRTDYLQYDSNGRALEIQDPIGVPTTLTYHVRGWINSRTTNGKTTAFAYDPAGNLTRVTQPDGSFINFAYDDAHRMNVIEDNLGNRVEYTLDADGNRTAENTYDDIGVLRRQMSRDYDQLSRLTTLLDGNSDPTLYGYDDNGNLKTTTDANTNVTSFEYDGLDRLVKTLDSILGETVMDYDERDNLVGVMDPMGNLTQYTYNGLDDQIQLDSPDSGTSTYEYDEAGNLTAATDARGIRTQYFYDALNRLIEIRYPNDTPNVWFSYDTHPNGVGRLRSMTYGARNVYYGYDARGNRVYEVFYIEARNYFTQYSYNDADRLTKITYPSGMVIDFTLDAAGRVIAADKTVDTVTESLISNVQYEPFGPAKSFEYGNGLTYKASLDLDYELDQLQSGNGLDWLIGHDPVGNILTIDDQLGMQNNQILTYDDLYRLDTARGDYGIEDFDHDANGNRTLYQNGLVDDPYTYELQSNRLATQNGWTFSRDAAGNRKEKLDTGGLGQLYDFGDHGRLIQVTRRDSSGDTVAAEYHYDGRGQRVRKIVGGVETHFIYGPSGELLGEYGYIGSSGFTEYVYLNGQPIAMITPSEQLVTPPGVELVLDNGDPGTSSTGKWNKFSNAQDYATDFLMAAKKASNTYRWATTPPGTNYEVYAWWAGHPSASSQVEYTVRYGSGETDIVTRSHQTDGGQWQLLGGYYSTDGKDYVEINAANGKTIADAIKWVEIPESGIEVVPTTYFIHSDHLGTPRQVSDDLQTLVWRWDSSPFGDSVPDEDPDGDSNVVTLNLRFPGQYFDEESGLNYNYFRTYDPSVGRYIESDPIGLGGGVNTFAFVGGNPLIHSDPLGLRISGAWIKDPKVNFTEYGLTKIRLISPYVDSWGYLKSLGVSGYAAGFVNLDIRCSNSDGCESQGWEIHKQIPFSFSGSKNFGPNIAAAGAGNLAGPLAGIVTGILTFGTSSLSALLGLLQDAEALGADKVQWLYGIGPDVICRGFR